MAPRWHASVLVIITAWSESAATHDEAPLQSLSSSEKKPEKKPHRMVPSAIATADRWKMAVHDIWVLCRDAEAVLAVRCHQKPHFQPRVQKLGDSESIHRDNYRRTKALYISATTALILKIKGCILCSVTVCH